jgi:hypothetical protein
VLPGAVDTAAPWFLNPVVLPALTGIGGVIIGGLITSVTNFGLAIWKEKRNLAKESKAQADLLRQAARLVSADFTSYISQIKRTIELRKFPNWADDPFKNESWINYRATFALTFSREQWYAVHVAAQVVQQFRGLREMVSQGHSDATIGEDVLRLLTDLLETLTKGRDMLNEFV